MQEFSTEMNESKKKNSVWIIIVIVDFYNIDLTSPLYGGNKTLPLILYHKNMLCLKHPTPVWVKFFACRLQHLFGCATHN